MAVGWISESGRADSIQIRSKFSILIYNRAFGNLGAFAALSSRRFHRMRPCGPSISIMLPAVGSGGRGKPDPMRQAPTFYGGFPIAGGVPGSQTSRLETALQPISDRTITHRIAGKIPRGLELRHGPISARRTTTATVCTQTGANPGRFSDTDSVSESAGETETRKAGKAGKISWFRRFCRIGKGQSKMAWCSHLSCRRSNGTGGTGARGLPSRVGPLQSPALRILARSASDRVPQHERKT